MTKQLSPLERDIQHLLPRLRKALVMCSSLSQGMPEIYSGWRQHYTFKAKHIHHAIFHLEQYIGKETPPS